MSVLLGAVYDRLPDTSVGAFMDVDSGRIVADRDADVLSLAEIFLTTPYRRLIVLEGERLEGLISRRDVLRAGLSIRGVVPDYLDGLKKDEGYSSRSGDGLHRGDDIGRPRHVENRHDLPAHSLPAGSPVVEGVLSAVW